MKSSRLVIGSLFLNSLLIMAGCTASVSDNSTIVDVKDVRTQELIYAMKAVEPFFEPLPPPAPQDWLSTFKEPGQTFAEYLNSNPTVPTAERNKLYVLPLGKFSERQRKVIEIASGYLGAFYRLEIGILPQQRVPRPLRLKDRRQLPQMGKEQVRTGYILDELLIPMLPADAAALIAFTDDDLFPDDTMYYVFGQASLENRVGVWSLSRLDNGDFDTFLRRTIKIATHETGHMFSIMHCTKYNCVMSGSNHLAETDSHPIDACPECMAKICWFSHVSPLERYKNLAEFCKANGLEKEGVEFERKLAAVSGQVD